MPDPLPRLLIVDSCILFSFFRKDSFRRRLIEELPNLGCQLVSPEFALRELASEKEKIIKYGRINELAFAFLLSLLERKIELFPEEEYRKFLADANKLSPHGSIAKDDPYFALALAFNCPIWSDEGAFKQQNKVKILSTRKLLELTGTYEKE